MILSYCKNFEILVTNKLNNYKITFKTHKLPYTLWVTLNNYTLLFYSTIQSTVYNNLHHCPHKLHKKETQMTLTFQNIMTTSAGNARKVEAWPVGKGGQAGAGTQTRLVSGRHQEREEERSREDEASTSTKRRAAGGPNA